MSGVNWTPGGADHGRTITPKLLGRKAPGLASQRRGEIGSLPTAAEMGEAIATAATDHTLPSGHIVVVGGTLESMLGS